MTTRRKRKDLHEITAFFRSISSNSVPTMTLLENLDGLLPNVKAGSVEKSCLGSLKEILATSDLLLNVEDAMFASYTGFQCSLDISILREKLDSIIESSFADELCHNLRTRIEKKALDIRSAQAILVEPKRRFDAISEASLNSSKWDTITVKKNGEFFPIAINEVRFIEAKPYGAKVYHSVKETGEINRSLKELKQYL